MSPDNYVNSLAQAFSAALARHDKAECIRLVEEALLTKRIGIPELYEGVLAHSLNQIASNEREQKIAVWEEHVQSGIVRSAIEISYPHLLRSLDQEDPVENLPKALVLCQEEEYHELGARMATDFLTILGFDVLFIGANTPASELFRAVRSLQPALVCISVTNFFHLTRLQRLIDDMRAMIAAGEVPAFRIVAGGYALKNTLGARDQIRPDHFAYNYRDLQTLKEEHYATGL